MIALFYEDHSVGQLSQIGSHRFTREAILDFARAWDPQPFHLDDAAAAASLFGRLCASGWHTASVCMRLMIDHRAAHRAAAAAHGEALPPLGVGAGIRDLRWLSPVYPEDVIAYSIEIVSMRETRKPQWGLIGIHARGAVEGGRDVLSYFSQALVARRMG